MAFNPDNKLSVGRPKGSVNKRTLEFKAVLEKHDFCPVSAMIECYREARKLFDNYGIIYDAIVEARDKSGDFVVPLNDEAHRYLKIAGDMAKDIASYTYPKLKAIEQVKVDPLKDMSAEERLDAMKQAVKFLEAQVKAGNGSSAT